MSPDVHADEHAGAMYMTISCDPVSSPNVKGRGASPATPWYVPTIVAFG